MDLNIKMEVVGIKVVCRCLKIIKLFVNEFWLLKMYFMINFGKIILKYGLNKYGLNC